MTAETYTPRGQTAEILDRALQLVRSVPYQVSARWLFYRLLQLGYYTSKGDYSNKFLKAVSTARRTFYGGWRPYTLADETREAIVRGVASESVEDWLQLYARGLTCTLDKWVGQDNYVELWYEARAMTQQFQHYTQHVTLRPMGGQPSIPYKWDTAKALERAASRYDLPIVILYFGDLDTAGELISEVVERDVREWCNVDFEFIRCGLNEDQVRRFDVPENPEKPGEYQWEALSDEGAHTIISECVDPYLRHDAFREIERVEERATKWVRRELVEIAKRWEGGAE